MVQYLLEIKSLLEIVCKIFLPLSLSLRNFLLLLLLTNLIFGQNNLFANSNRPLAFVTNQGDDSVSVINLSDFKLIDTISVGKSPAGIVVDITRDGLDEDSLYKSALKLLDPETRNKMAEQAYKRYNDYYTVNAMVDTYHKLYQPQKMQKRDGVNI